MQAHYASDNVVPLRGKMPSGESPESLDAILTSVFAGTRCFAEKETLFHEGGRAERVFMIRRGMVKLLSYLPNGRARIVRLHTRGQWLGLEAVVGQPYQHTAVALDEVEMAYVPAQRLRTLERDRPLQYCQVLKQGYKHLTQADKWIADFSTGGIRPRVARLVEFMSTLEFGESSNRVKLLAVHEMADMLGVTPESVSRILAEFKRKNVLNKVDVSSAHLYHIDAQQLQHEARQ